MFISSQCPWSWHLESSSICVIPHFELCRCLSYIRHCLLPMKLFHRYSFHFFPGSQNFITTAYCSSSWSWPYFVVTLSTVFWLLTIKLGGNLENAFRIRKAAFCWVHFSVSCSGEKTGVICSHWCWS